MSDGLLRADNDAQLLRGALLAHGADEAETFAQHGADQALLLAAVTDRMARRMRVLSADSETMRPPQMAESKSSLLTTCSRWRSRYSSKSKTCGSTGTGAPPQCSSRRLVSKTKF